MRLTELDGRRFRVITDSGKEITFSEHELLGLFQLAAPFQDQLKAQRKGRKPYPLATERVSLVTLSLDAHHTEVVVRFVPLQGGNESAYVIPPDVAELMRDDLGKKLEQIAAAKQNRTNN
ncbi:hypothetical protein QA649_19690 [Bradyrhizobium sp. CB1717]|uniref:hypothetical protein n=1 Tax=Bradyrhizobium sp. CB1717 TaxID=3039154 RepID=UPI0024B071A7|nr:hypothetical protein [Bradyrhizobium sp. CB1717]WFU28354.1 hypothetical protein QA649_19690 [Bradyrhizobium sp. CB1717]